MRIRPCLLLCLFMAPWTWAQIDVISRSAIIGHVPSSNVGAYGVTSIDDFDGDGVPDLAMGVPRDTGDIFISLLNRNGTQKKRLVIGTQTPGLIGAIKVRGFGQGVATLRPASLRNRCAQIATSFINMNKLWILEVCPEGSEAKVSKFYSLDTLHPGLSGKGWYPANLGKSVTLLKVLPSGRYLIAAGAPAANDKSRGRVVLFSLDSSLKTPAEILSIFDDGTPQLQGKLDSSDQFGDALSRVEDLDGDGVDELAVTALGDDDVRINLGAVYLLYLNSSNGIKNVVKISGSNLAEWNNPELTRIANGVTSADFDHDGVADLVVSGYGYNSAPTLGNGGLSILYMKPDGMPKSVQIIRKGFPGLDSLDGAWNRILYAFGSALTTTDFNGDEMPDLIVGAQRHRDTGGVWVIPLASPPWLKQNAEAFRIRANRDSTLFAFPDHFGGYGLSYSINQLDGASHATCQVTTSSPPQVSCQALDRNGWATFIAKAIDRSPQPGGAIDSVCDTFQIEVFSENRIPTSSLSESATLREDQADTVLLDLLQAFHDEDSADPVKHDSLRFELIPLGRRLVQFSQEREEINGQRMLSARPLPDMFGRCSLLVVARDKYGTEVRDTLQVEVLPVQDPPQAVGDRFVDLVEEQERLLDVLQNDVELDGDSLTIEILTPPVHGAASVRGNAIAYLPHRVFNGPDSLLYRISDPGGASEAWARFHIQPVDGGPVVVRPLEDLTLSEDDPARAIAVDSIFYDGEDGYDGLTLVTGNTCSAIASVQFRRVERRLVVTPRADQSGECAIWMSATDVGDRVVSDTMQVVIAAVEDLFHFGSDTLIAEISSGDSFTYSLPAVDGDGDTLSYGFPQGVPAWIAWDSAQGRLAGRMPPQAAEGWFTAIVREAKSQGSELDTLTIVTRLKLSSAARIRFPGRKGLTVSLRRKERELVFQGLQGAYRIQIVSSSGRIVGRAGGRESAGSLVLPLAGTSGPLLVRLADQRGPIAFKVFLAR